MVKPGLGLNNEKCSKKRAHENKSPPIKFVGYKRHGYFDPVLKTNSKQVICQSLTEI